MRDQRARQLVESRRAGREGHDARGDDDAVGANELAVVERELEPVSVRRQSLDTPVIEVGNGLPLEPPAVFDEAFEGQGVGPFEPVQLVEAIQAEPALRIRNV